MTWKLLLPLQGVSAACSGRSSYSDSRQKEAEQSLEGGERARWVRRGGETCPRFSQAHPASESLLRLLAC